MDARPYTAVLIQGKKTRVVNINAPLNRHKALEVVSAKFPQEQVVALVPGLHAEHSFTYHLIPGAPNLISV